MTNLLCSYIDPSRDPRFLLLKWDELKDRRHRNESSGPARGPGRKGESPERVPNYISLNIQIIVT